MQPGGAALAPPAGYAAVQWEDDTAYPDPNNPTHLLRDALGYSPNLGFVDARTTTTETIRDASLGKLVTLTNSGAVAVTLDSAHVPAGFMCFLVNLGAGTATLTPSSGTIKYGGVSTSSLALTEGEGAIPFFDGTNWEVIFTQVPSVLTAYATQAGIQAETYTYAADTGAANAYAIAPGPAIGSYAAGQGFAFLAAHANSGASTLNVSALGAKTLKKWSSGSLTDLATGDISAGQILYAKYDGTYFQVLGGLPASGGGGGSAGTPVENEVVTFTGTSGTLANTPSAIAGYTQVKLYRDGQRLRSGAGNDYTWSGAAITLATASAASVFIADYYK